MTREEVWKRVAEVLRADFGRLVEVRDVRRVRRVAGEAWSVTVVLAASGEDIHIADLSVDDESAKVTPTLGPDDFVRAIRRPRSTAKVGDAALPDELAGFGADDGDGLGDLDGALDILEDEPIEARIANALAKGDRESLRAARDLLPRLLGEHDRRGATLFTMAEVELSLGETGLAKGYLEAAAREFADRFDLTALEKAAALALQIDGREGFAGSPIHALLEQSRARLTPLESLFAARSFAALGPDLAAEIGAALTVRTLAPGETLVSEGEPSRSVFVVKSGLVGVYLEKPSGGAWMVRSCFPGWLLGESSVLGDGPARCTATLRAERVSEVWILPSEVVRSVMARDADFAQRIRDTKQLHRIDSFFSMHETMGQLDVQVRDEMLSCIQRLETYDAETVLSREGEVPDVAMLVAKGSIALVEPGKSAPLAVIEPDAFYGVRDTIHRIAPAVTAVARPGTTVAFFDGARLSALCERSPEQVVAVLERLG